MKKPYYLERPYQGTDINLSGYEKRGKAFEVALLQVQVGELKKSKLAYRLKEKGGMICGASWSGLMVGPNPRGCPPGWLYLPMGTSATVIQAALEAIKEPIVT